MPLNDTYEYVRADITHTYLSTCLSHITIIAIVENVWMLSEKNHALLCNCQHCRFQIESRNGIRKCRSD